MNDQPEIGDFVYLKVIGVNADGARLALNDDGLEVYIPYFEQRSKMEEGDSYVVVLQEKTSKGFTGSGKIEDFLDRNTSELQVNQEVNLIITRYTPIGMSVIINERFPGLIYSNEIFSTVNVGDRVTGYIKKIKEDGKVDVALQKQGVAAIEDNTLLILNKLKEKEGFLGLSDSSEPGKIYEELGISKKLFKKAIGTLYKKKLIEISDDGIRLVSTE